MTRRFALLLLLPLLALGCQRTDTDARAEAPPPDPDTPLELKVNAKGQVWLGGKWRDLFFEHEQVRAWLKNRGEQYRLVYEQRELSLPAIRSGRRRVEFLPVPVQVQVEPKTKSGFVGALKRLCREFGFVQIEVQVAEEPFES